jgi:hypothetical protein
MLQAESEMFRKMKKASDVEIVSIARFDGFLNAMHQVSEEEEIDFVVMGTNGQTHPKFESREDDPMYFMHKINKPVLLIPLVAPL